MRKCSVLAAVAALSLAGATTLAQPIKGIVVTSDKSVNCSSIKSMVADVVAGCKTDKDKALAVFNFVTRMMWIPYDYDQPKEAADLAGKSLASVTDPVRNLVVYGAGGCGIQQVVFGSLLKEAGLEERSLNPGFAHVSNEVKFDGKWRWLDTWLPLYLYDEQGEIYSYDDLMANRELIKQAIDAKRVPENFMYNPSDANGIAKAKGHRAGGSAARKADYSENLCLRPGESVAWLWDSLNTWYWPGEQFSHPGFKFAADKNAKLAFPHWEPYAKEIKSGIPYHPTTHYRYTGNAVFTTKPPLSKAGLEALGAKLENVKFVQGGVSAEGGSGTIELAFALPYAIADTRISGTLAMLGTDVQPQEATAPDVMEITYSLDNGKTWLPETPKQVTAQGKFGPVSIGQPNSKAFPAGTTSGQYKYLLKIALKSDRNSCQLKDIQVVNTTMLNFYSRLWLEVGKNNVAVTAAGDKAALAKNPLEVTWKWLEDWKEPKSFTQKVADSPAKAVIDVGGPKRPKMVSITISCPTGK